MPKFEFKNQVELQPYCFDFHSHLNGILPVESKLTPTAAYEHSSTETKISIDQNDELSMLGFIKRTPSFQGKKQDDDARLALFRSAVEYLAKKDNLPVSRYTPTLVRGECAAENVYIACVILADLLHTDSAHRNPSQPAFYQAILRLCDQYKDKAEQLPSEAREIIRHFNHKIYSANKYTPFDDCYELRSAVTDSEPKYLWEMMTLAFQTAQGVQYSQIATSLSSIKKISSLVSNYNSKHGTQHKLLAHTPHGYTDKNQLEKNLTEITEYITDKNAGDAIIGIDILGQENSIADHETILNIIHSKLKEKSNSVNNKKVTLHIHAGEGSAHTLDNRSVAGYWFMHNPDTADKADEFFHAFSRYILRAYRNTTAQRASKRSQAERWSSVEQDNNPDGKGVSRLFDELFHYNQFIFNGTACRRFDISSPATRALVQYHGKRNMAALEKALESESGSALRTNDHLAIRVGHGYYYRDALLDKFDNIHFDCNLGSNTITGTSGLFPDIESYRLNKGIRKLRGMFDSEIFNRLSDVVFPIELEISDIEEKYLLAEKKGKTNSDATGKERNESDTAYDKTTAENEGGKKDESEKNNSFPNQNIEEKLKELIYRAALLGADGQGIEHTDIQIEAMRMAILISSFQAKYIPGTALSLELLIENAKQLNAVARQYWENTVDKPLGKTETRCNTINHFRGQTKPGGSCFIDAVPFHSQQDQKK
ncbi:hypothetical protein J9978_05080 [Chromobacterium violaceum]|uniref:hypothetical protein n=1 Tax=Chromobacterium violaceum TaxID=536 RepID=UPI001B318F9D|nr:hypothetical protein [Chromobacterium violaceum]MBP4048870.1 hypothetical protein [Chromobacterium violaceum]